jgi:hypothetical protein
VRRAFLDLLDAYRRRDIGAVLAAKAKQSRATEVAFMKNYSIRLFRITAISVEGDTATIDYENSIVARNLTSYVSTLLAQRDTWTKRDGHWLEVSDVASTPGIPQGLESTMVTLPDGGPIEIPASLRQGTTVAFLVQNPGTVAKGLFILGIPAHLDVATFFSTIARTGDERDAGGAAQFPAGVLEIGATADIPASGTGTMVFNASLPAGRYLLVARDADVGSLRPGEDAVFTVTK